MILHSHTPEIIALTFILPLEDSVFTRSLWGMMTECPVIFPSGIGVVKWMVPGGKAIAEVSAELMKKFDIVVWAHHGTFCSGETFDAALRLMETAEKAAGILFRVISMGGARQEITDDNFKSLARDFNISLNEKFFR